jgi:putative oxidoreductase
MPIADLISRLRRLELAVAGAVLPWAPVLARLVYGQAFVQTGYGKLTNFQRTVNFFVELGIPMPAVNAGFVGCVELVGGICLLLGLGTRIASVLLLSTMVVAIITAEGGKFVDALLWRGEFNLSDVTPVPFLVVLVWLIGQGPGRLALDNLLGRNRRAELTEPVTAS